MTYRTEREQGVLDNGEVDGKALVESLVRAAGEKNTATESEMDAFLAGELNQMSLEERQKVFEEIHGVERIVEETPEFVAESLHALDDAIANIHPKEAYEMAEELSWEFVHNRDFRLTFLRADLFDPVKAAKRMVIFFECRLSLFGPALLTKKLTMSDLDADDLATLKSGYFQILPSRDTTGRAVLANVQGMFKRSYKRAANMQRMYHYMTCAMTDDLDTQLHGCVIILYQIGSYEYEPPPDLFKGGTNLILQGCPVRICGMHFCLDNPLMKAISRVVLAVSGRDVRARNRFHEGSHTEVQYRLLSFGIPVDLLPITAEGELKKANHNKWLAMRKAKEATKVPPAQYGGDGINSIRIDLPSRNDVLMGKGKPVQEHSGNVAMRDLVGLYMSDYNSSPKHGKVTFVKKVYQAIQSSQGRFLKKNTNGWWILATEEEARDKISKTFTSEQAKAKRTKTIQQCNSEYIVTTKRTRPKVDEWSCFSGFPGMGCNKMAHMFGNENDLFHVPKRQKPLA